MRLTDVLVLGAALALAACAAPPSGGLAVGPTVPAATSDEVGATSGPTPSPSPGTPAASPGDRRGPTDSPSPTTPRPTASEAGPSGRAGPAPALPTLPDRTLRSAAEGLGGGVNGSADPPPDHAPGAPGDLAREWAGAAPGDWRTLAGFVGSQWDQDLSGELEVLIHTITIRDGVATGLVRNERDVATGPIVVTAAGVQAEALVPVARPGEPVPFHLTVGDVDLSEITWAASAPEATPVARDLLLVTWWQRGVNDQRPVDTYLWTDPESGPQAIVVFGTATAVAAGMDGIGMVGAWVDQEGRVLAVAEGVVGQPSVPSGAAADFVVAATGPDALDDADLMLWGWGE